MTIKTTLGALAAASGALHAVMEEKLPIVVAVKVSLLVKKFNDEVKTFDEQRRALFTEFGEKKGEQMFIPEKNSADFKVKMDQLFAIPVELNVEPIKLAQLGDDISVATKNLILLEEAGLLMMSDEKPPSPAKPKK